MEPIGYFFFNMNEPIGWVRSIEIQSHNTYFHQGAKKIFEDNMQLNAIIEKDENGYYAYVPELKGCYSQGKNFEEALANIREAAELYIEDLSEDEKSFLQTKSFFIAPINVNQTKVV